MFCLFFYVLPVRLNFAAIALPVAVPKQLQFPKLTKSTPRRVRYSEHGFGVALGHSSKRRCVCWQKTCCWFWILFGGGILIIHQASRDICALHHDAGSLWTFLNMCSFTKNTYYLCQYVNDSAIFIFDYSWDGIMLPITCLKGIPIKFHLPLLLGGGAFQHLRCICKYVWSFVRIIFHHLFLLYMVQACGPTPPPPMVMVPSPRPPCGRGGGYLLSYLTLRGPL